MRELGAPDATTTSGMTIRDLARKASHTCSFAVATALLLPGLARADYTDLYTVVGYEAGLGHYVLPADGSGSVTTYTGGITASVFYGFSNTFHLGGQLRLTSKTDARFGGVTLTLPPGVDSTGDVYSDHFGVSLGALLHYRFDTGQLVVPVLEIEGGITVHDYHDIIQVPGGATYSISLASLSEVVVQGSATVLFEYRFKNAWVASTGLGVMLEPSGGLMPWSVSIPIRLGRIW